MLRKALYVQRYCNRTVSAYLRGIKIFFSGIRVYGLKIVVESMLDGYIYLRIRMKKN